MVLRQLHYLGHQGGVLGRGPKQVASSLTLFIATTVKLAFHNLLAAFISGYQGRRG